MRSKLILVSILLIAAILRLFALGITPHGIYSDEASLGYNAWSILTTGHDEFGKSYPLTFQAFAEYKLPVYIYTSIPFIALFGLSPFSIRIVSAIAGIVATYGIYVLCRTSFHKNEGKEIISLSAAALFAVSPWSIHFSRGGFEANLALCLIIFGVYLFISYTETFRPYHLLSAVLLFVLALYTYNAARVFLPIYITILVVMYSHELFKSKDKLLPLISGGIILFTILYSLMGSIFGAESARANQVLELENKQYALGPLLGVLEKYLTHFSAEFLFFSGDVLARHSVREVGELLLPQLLFIAIGVYSLITNPSRISVGILLWLIIAPLPAAIATPVPHALRSLLLLPPLTILTAVGLTTAYNLIRQKRLPAATYTAGSICFIFFAYSVFTYLHVYFKHYAYKSSWDWDEDKTVLGQTLATEYAKAPRIYIETAEQNQIYLKFFTASQGQAFIRSRYIFFSNMDEISPQNGDIVAINGWKGTPEQLSGVKELKMRNNSIGFKVGEWRSDE